MEPSTSTNATDKVSDASSPKARIFVQAMCGSSRGSPNSATSETNSSDRPLPNSVLAPRFKKAGSERGQNRGHSPEEFESFPSHQLWLLFREALRTIRARHVMLRLSMVPGSPLSVLFLIMAVIGAAMASAALTSAFHRPGHHRLLQGARL